MTGRMAIIVVFLISLRNLVFASNPILLKYEKWKVAIENPTNSAKIFAFFYNNPHWPLFNDTVKEAEKNITPNVSDSMLLRWFKRYPPKTSEGTITYINILLRTNQKYAKNYIKQTWIFQNLSPEFVPKFKELFGEYISSTDDAKKAKFLISKMRIDQLTVLKSVVSSEIAKFISSFLRKQTAIKTAGYSKGDLKDIAKKYAIVKKLIDLNQYKNAANILTLSNENETVYGTEFFNQRRNVAFNILRTGNSKLAYRVMEMFEGNSETRDERVAKAEWLLGYISFRFLNDKKKSIEHFETAYNNSKNQIRLSKNAFWLAEVHRSQSDLIPALEWYKKAAKHFSTFYGYLASERIRAIDPQSVSDDFEAPVISMDVAVIFYNRELVQVLSALKDRSMAQLFYKQLIREIDDPNEEILLLNIAFANDEQSILISENSQRQHYFPVQKAYKTLTNTDMEYVRKTDDTPCFMSLAHSIIHRESNFDELAQSYVGAVGLMQIMPKTAQFEASRIHFYNGRSLFDRQKNIIIGTAILSRLLKKYKDELISVIASYNCGEGNFSKYQKSIKNLKNLTLIDIIELIPIKETRIYVKHVIRSMFAYSKMFDAGDCYNCKLIFGE
ncbi:MAG: lytic transglycosylase domain-containing protein [Holosporales bacterium]|nr:lytic transglycosylase domain-containing protein [Holosporales bacterium]